MNDLTDIVRFFKELGPIWGPPAVFLGLIIWRARQRWLYEGARGHKLFWDRWALVIFPVGAVFLSGYYYYRWRYWGLPPPFEKGEIGILIGQVPGDTNQQQQAAYAREIRALVEKTPELTSIVKVEMLGRPLPADPEEQQATALQWGRWLRATFVLRTNVVEGVHEPWITVVDQAEFSTAEAPMGKFSNEQIPNLDQLPLPSNVLLLARCTVALAFYQRRSYEQIARELQYVLAAPGLPEAAPSRSKLSYMYGNALLSLGKNDEAVAQFKKAIALKPGFSDAHVNLGCALAGKHDLDAAIAEYREALRLNPNSIGGHYNLGNALHAKPDLDGAIAEFRETLRLKEDFAEAHYNLGNALFDKPDLDGAVTEYREALRFKPDLAEAHYNLGNALRDKHDPDGAIAEYREAVRVNPKHAEAHDNLGIQLTGKQDVDGAIAEFHEALRLNPNSAEAHYNLGIVLLVGKRDLDGAIAEFREAVRLKPDYADAHNNLGGALFYKHELDAAIAEYHETLRLKPDYPDAHKNMGTALYNKHDLKGAIAEFREAVRLRPDDAEAHQYLGTALYYKRDLVS